MPISGASIQNIRGDTHMTNTQDKVVVITGSTKGLGFEMARRFRKKGLHVVVNGRDEKRVAATVKKLERIESEAGILGVAGNISVSGDIQNLMDRAVERFGHVDIWINNAGVNQPDKALWELSEEEIDQILNVDLRGAILGSRVAALQMEQQPEGGMIYNIEGHGSNDAMIMGLSMYGTSKRAVTYFTKAFAKELSERGSKVKIGRLSPGIMITDFTSHALGGQEDIELSDKTKQVYNILGDRPGTVAGFLVSRILATTKNNAHIQWLTKRKAAWRFMTAGSRQGKYY